MIREIGDLRSAVQNIHRMIKTDKEKQSNHLNAKRLLDMLKIKAKLIFREPRFCRGASNGKGGNEGQDLKVAKGRALKR